MSIYKPAYTITLVDFKAWTGKKLAQSSLFPFAL